MHADMWFPTNSSLSFMDTVIQQSQFLGSEVTQRSFSPTWEPLKQPFWTPFSLCLHTSSGNELSPKAALPLLFSSDTKSSSPVEDFYPAVLNLSSKATQTTSNPSSWNRALQGFQHRGHVLLNLLLFQGK